MLRLLRKDAFHNVQYMTGPAQIGHVGTNYTPSHNISYLSTGIEYFYSVTCIVNPTKCLIRVEGFMATESYNTKL